MKEYFGTPKSGGIAEGKLYLFSHDKCLLRRYHIEDSSGEIKRFEKAREVARSELENLFEKAVNEIGEEDAGIFSNQIALLDDATFNDSVYDMITDQMVNAEVAVAQTSEILSDVTELTDDEYIGTRSYDIQDVCERIIRILLGVHLNEITLNEPVIVVAKTLPPSDFVRFDRKKILGIVLEYCEDDFHEMAFADSKGFPIVVGMDNIMEKVKTGDIAVLDGDNGILKLQ